VILRYEGQRGVPADVAAPSPVHLGGFLGYFGGVSKGFPPSPEPPKNSRAGVSNPLKENGSEIKPLGFFRAPLPQVPDSAPEFLGASCNVGTFCSPGTRERLWVPYPLGGGKPPAPRSSRARRGTRKLALGLAIRGAEVTAGLGGRRSGRGAQPKGMLSRARARVCVGEWGLCGQ
jgi:hypothetical protein